MVLGFAAPASAATIAGVAKPAATASGVPDFYADEVAARARAFDAAPASPTAVIPLLGALDLWELLIDRQALVDFVRRVADSPRALPIVRARALYMSAQLEARLGHRDVAAAQRRRLGIVEDLWIVGPFDNDSGTGHDTAYGPEVAANSVNFDAGAHWPGRGTATSVGWRRLTGLAHAGQWTFDCCVRPSGPAVVYATFAFRLDAAADVALRLGSSGALKVWVVGVAVGAHNVRRAAHFDQDAFGLHAERGWHRALVKLSVAESAPDLTVRLSRLDGGPLTGVTLSAHPADLAAANKSAVATRPAVDVGHLLAALATRDPRAFGLYLAAVSPEDPDTHHAAQLLERAAAMPGYYSDVAVWAALARVASDPNESRRALEEGLAAQPASAAHARARLKIALGDALEAGRRERLAEALWRQALVDSPDAWPARLRLADLAADRGLPMQGQVELGPLVTDAQDKAGKREAGPFPLAVLRALATNELRRGRRTNAGLFYLILTVDDAEDFESRREIFAMARARGDIARALSELDQLYALRPGEPSTLGDRAEVLADAGRLPEAVATIDQALLLAPDDAPLIERRGRLLMQAGRRDDGLLALNHALLLKPQNPELRAYLAAERGSPGSDLARLYAVDVAELVAAAKKTPPPSSAGAPARVLLDLEAVRVHENGLSESFAERVVQVLDDRGVQKAAEFAIRFTPDTQSVEVQRARVFKADGEIVEATSTDEEDLSEPWYGLYYDVRAEVVHMPALAPGDVVDVEYIVSDVASRNMFSDYFGDVHFFEEDLPRLASTYILRAPQSRVLYFNTPQLPNLVRTDRVEGNEHVYTFTAANTRKLDSEPGMPGFSEIAAYLHVSTYGSWSDVARWYRGLVAPQLETDDAIRQAVKDAVRGAPAGDERARIFAVYGLVLDRTRYVGLEFGIHGYQPYRVAQVFARKFGDCKDKASLLIAMLKEIGVEAHLVLLRTRRNGDLSPSPASLAPFDHVIAYVPKYDLYLDGTAEFSGAEELPAPDQAVMGLDIAAGKTVRTPVLPPDRNLVTSQWDVMLQKSGDAVVDEALTIHGQAASEWRQAYQSPSERNDKYGKAWSEKHPGASLQALAVHVESRLAPVAVTAKVAVPRYARVSDGERGALLVPVLGREAEMQSSYARLSSRQYDLILGYPWVQEETVTLHLPAGATASLPAPRTVTSKLGSFTLAVTKEGDAVVSRARLELDTERVAQADYAAFRRFCGEVDAAVGGEIVVRP